MSKSMTCRAGCLFVSFLCGSAAVQAQDSPIEASIYVTDPTGAVVFSVQFTQAQEQNRRGGNGNRQRHPFQCVSTRDSTES